MTLSNWHKQATGKAVRLLVKHLDLRSDLKHLDLKPDQHVLVN